MSPDQPGLRIGDAERDRAVQLLQQQRTDGRIDDDELVARTGQIRAARTREEMVPAFADLPADPPAAEQNAFPLYPGTDPVTGAATSSESQQLAVPEAGEPDRRTTGSDPYPRRNTSPRVKMAGRVAIGLMWPLAVVLNIIFGWHLWWLFPVVGMSTGWVAWAFGLWGSKGEDD